MGVQYQVDGDDLTAIANKIRTKGGTSASLEFPTGFEDAVDAIPTGIQPTGTKQINISANGTTTHDVENYANAQVVAAVPNTYSAGDEGKVVSDGALVAQTSDTVTQNGTVDTTLINSLTVNVSGGGGGLPADMTYSSITYTPTADIGTTNNYFGSIVAAIFDLLPENTLFVRVTLSSGSTSQFSLKALSVCKLAYPETAGTVRFYRFNPANTVSLVTRNNGGINSYSLYMRAGSEYLIEYITGNAY